MNSQSLSIYTEDDPCDDITKTPNWTDWYSNPNG